MNRCRPATWPGRAIPRCSSVAVISGDVVSRMHDSRTCCSNSRRTAALVSGRSPTDSITTSTLPKPPYPVVPLTRRARRSASRCSIEPASASLASCARTRSTARVAASRRRSLRRTVMPRPSSRRASIVPCEPAPTTAVRRIRCATAMPGTVGEPMLRSLWSCSRARDVCECSRAANASASRSNAVSSGSVMPSSTVRTTGSAIGRGTRACRRAERAARENSTRRPGAVSSNTRVTSPRRLNGSPRP